VVSLGASFFWADPELEPGTWRVLSKQTYRDRQVREGPCSTQRPQLGRAELEMS
jgi:hypothetical protein